MCYLFICVFLSITCVSHSKVIAEDKHMIVGGQRASSKDYPYYAVLKAIAPKAIKLCGGGIIGKKWIITAAHCVHDKLEDLQVAVGIDKLSDFDSHRVKVHSAFLHPNYSKKSNYDDIALIKLSSDLLLNGTLSKLILPLPVEEYGLVGNEFEMNVAGFGLTEENGQVSPYLRDIKINLLFNTKCSWINSFKPRGQICAGNLRGQKDSCTGDSGGPLVYKKKSGSTLIGLVSFGLGCARPGIPGIYTRVSNYLEWIRSVTSAK